MKRIKNLRRWFFPLLAASLALGGLCGAENEARKVPRWSVVIYGHADHNLSPSLLADIKEMSAEGSDDRFTIVMQTDFDASLASDLEEDGLPDGLAEGGARLRVTKAEKAGAASVTVLERIPEPDMDQPATLTAFLSWALKKFPAERHGLILWDHGGQWKGYGGDTQDGTREEPGDLKPADLRRAVDQAMADAGLKKWDFIGFDTCLMGGAEVLESLVGLTDLVIACPEIDFGDGWDYAAFFHRLKQRPDAPPRDLGVMEADAWKAQHLTPANLDDRVLAGHAAYDMTAWPRFEAALKSFAQALKLVTGDALVALAAARLGATEYDISGLESLGEPSEYVDAAEFARKVAKIPGLPEAVGKAAVELEQAVGALVVKAVLGAAHASGGGLSLWYPRTGKPLESATAEAEEEEAATDEDPDQLLRDAEAAANQTMRLYGEGGARIRAAWSEHLNRVYDSCLAHAEDPLELEDPAEDPDAALSLPPGESVSLPVKITQGKAAWRLTATIVDTAFTPKDYEVTYLGEVVSLPANGPGSYTPRWDGRLPALVAGNQRAWLGAVPLAEGDGTLLVSNARYYAPGSRKALDVLLLSHLSNGKARLIGVLDAGDDDTAPSALEVEAGGRLQPVYLTEKRKGDNPDKWKTRVTPAKERFTIPADGIGAMTVAYDRVSPGAYYVELQVEDVYGNTSDILEKEVEVLPAGQEATR